LTASNSFHSVFVAVSAFTALVKHSSHINIGRPSLHLLDSFYGLFFLCGAAYLAIAFSLHCPIATSFLVNPKGFGPRGFIYYASCPRRWHLNPWAIQIVTFLQTRRMRCINAATKYSAAKP
jgi:hypothetical protein